MADNPFAPYPARPRDVGEWEDLLVRFELTPRVLRLALEAAPDIDTPDPALAEVAAQLHHLAEREAEAWGWLQAFREGGQLEPWRAEHPTVDSEAALRTDTERFTSFRARNFAWVQRRGLEVWDWAAEHPEFGEVTAFQVLSYLVRHDGRHLAYVREAFRGAGRC